jgi:catechol 2,3-dioxygenase-like lactoylglutathione lyase family enzyme
MAKLVPELYCSDFKNSLRFYVELLGFRILYDRPEEKFAYLDREGAELMIEQPAGRRWLTGELTRPFGRGINLQIEVSAIDALHDKCRIEQVPIFLAPRIRSTGEGTVSFAAGSSSCRILTAIFCGSSRGWEPCRRRIDRRRRPHGRDAGGKTVGIRRDGVHCAARHAT